MDYEEEETNDANKSLTLTVRVHGCTAARLKALANELDVSQSDLIRFSLERVFRQHSDENGIEGGRA